ncbi:MAG: DNA repair exonuclease [Oscillospiraceae bacterium]|nr:DNA repair exonuclease [Oscillospiraceae bacterium]
MLKIIHAADLHLDSPFSGLSPDRAALRREEQRALLGRLGELATEEQADLVLLAGDLLDTGRLYQQTAQALADALGRIPARVFIAPGNHDPYTAASPYAQPIWPDNVHIFTSPIPQAVAIPELGCTVYGAAFTQEQNDHPPLESFRAEGDGLKVMVLHGNAAGANYAPITPAHIARSGLDYLALGHIHMGSGLQRSGSTFWAYPGCPEGRGFDETGDKGVLLIQLDDGQANARFVPLAGRRYQILDVDLTHSTDPTATVSQALSGDTSHDIYRIRLTGRYALDSTQLRQLEQALAPRFWAMEVQDRTRMPQDLWARMQEDSLTGLFLQTMAQQCQQEPDNEVLELAVRFGLAALENGEDVAP